MIIFACVSWIRSLISSRFFYSVCVDLQYDEIYLIFTAGSVCLCGVCSPVVVIGVSVSLS